MAGQHAHARFAEGIPAPAVVERVQRAAGIGVKTGRTRTSASQGG